MKEEHKKKNIFCKLGLHKWSKAYMDMDQTYWRICLNCELESAPEGENEIVLFGIFQIPEWLLMLFVLIWIVAIFYIVLFVANLLTSGHNIW